MRWRVLGQVQTWDGHAWQPIAADKQRQLLAILLTHPNRPLDRGWLIDVLWNQHPPESAGQVLAHYVWRLRKLPAVGTALRTVPVGYQLDVLDGELDAQRFAALVDEGRAAAHGGDHAAAVDLLSSALDLRLGRALADSRTLPVLDEAARQLDQRHVDAQEALADALLAADRPAEAVPVLNEIVAAEPYRERSWQLLLQSLHRGGRRADALLAYQRLCRIWSEQLGLEPSPPLQELHQRLLANSLEPTSVHSGPAAVPRAVPRQLPTAHRHFVGRQAALSVLTGLADQAAGGSAPVVVAVISGTGGVGKTALALHWAHQAGERFADGQLFANLRGFGGNDAPVTPAEAMRGFLEALGVPAERIPGSIDAQAVLYRSMLAGRRVLVLLDNAHDPDQVRPLLPGTPGALVLVTSRNALTGLMADGAQPVTLDLFTDKEARDLLGRHLGPARVVAEPVAIDNLVARCAGLPLALAIAAARASTRPAHSLDVFASELADPSRRLDALDTLDPGTKLRAVFSWSYRQLSPAAADLFRCLGLPAGPDISAPAVASLAGVPIVDARRLLAELTEAHLLTEPVPHRYTHHDLLRAYAREQAHTHDSDSTRLAAEHRLLDHYLHSAHAAAQRLHAHRLPVTIAPARAGTAPEHPSDNAQAIAWFTAEHRTMLAAIARAAEIGLDLHAWQLAWTLASYLDWRGHWHDLAATQTAALAAAKRLGAADAEAHTRRLLARAHRRLGRLDEAYEHAREALELARTAGDEAAQAHAHISVGTICERQERHGLALEHSREALDLYRRLADPVGQATALNNICVDHTALGEYTPALAAGQQALAILEEAGHRPGQAATWDSIGYTHHCLGDHRSAIACYHRAIQLHRAVGNRFFEADTLAHLGDTYAAAGDGDDAQSAWQQALVILTELQHPSAAGIRAKLDASRLALA
jgi:DNA-binding SARP family transcriptional activator